MSEIQTPNEITDIRLKAVGSLAYLLSVIRCGDKLSDQEISCIQDTMDALKADADRLTTVEHERDKLQKWVNDLQSGMYINCVYCGHRYGPEKNTPVAMADVLKAHIEQCPKHPMSALKHERDAYKRKLELLEGQQFEQECAALSEKGIKGG